MIRSITFSTVLILFIVQVAAIAFSQEKVTAETAAKAYEALLKEYEEVGNPREMAVKFFEFSKKYSKEPAAIDALTWIATHLRYSDEEAHAIGMLESNHLQSEKLAEVARSVAKGLSPEAEKLLQAALKKSSHHEVQAEACYRLVLLLERQLSLAEELSKQPRLRKRAIQYYGKKLVEHLVSLDSQKVDKQIEALCVTMIKLFPEESLSDGTMGEFAKSKLFALRHLSVGKQAPEIEGIDIDGQNFKLSEYRGKVVMLSFWGHW